MSPVIDLPDQEIATSGTASKQPLRYGRAMSSGTIEPTIPNPLEKRLGPLDIFSHPQFDDPVTRVWAAGSPLHASIEIDNQYPVTVLSDLSSNRLIVDVGTSEGRRAFTVERLMIAEGVQVVLFPGAIAERLGELARLEPDWDDSGGLSTTVTARLTTQRILSDLLDRSDLPDHITDSIEILPISNGGLLIILTGNTSEAHLRVRPGGSLDVLMVRTAGHDRTYEELHQISREEAVRYLHEVSVGA